MESPFHPKTRLLMKNETKCRVMEQFYRDANADRIFVLSDGKLAEEGKFDELRAHGGLFSSMWDEYQKSVYWKVSKEA